jgi:pyrroloquinoline quinone biosynthesis protein B
MWIESGMSLPGRRADRALLGFLGLAVLFSLGCRATGEQSLPSGPFVLVLGTAQDGGLPQLGCRAEPCQRARQDPSHRRLVASLLLADPRSGRRWLIDATPDLSEQVDLVEQFAPRAEAGGRPALFDGIFLTHAHYGHYTGLAQLGREVYGSATTPVHGSARMCQFLSTNGPWDLLVSAGHIAPSRMEPGVPVELAPDLRVTAFVVPHRDEYTDTLGFLVEGPERSLIYVPDVDKWPLLEPPIEERIARVDHALLDGTFFADGEIPGRAMSEIPHPFIVESLERFASLSAGERGKVYFTHLNHTNPVADPAGEAARQVRDAGCSVAGEGQVLPL